MASGGPVTQTPTYGPSTTRRQTLCERGYCGPGGSWSGQHKMQIRGLFGDRREPGGSRDTGRAVLLGTVSRNRFPMVSSGGQARGDSLASGVESVRTRRLHCSPRWARPRRLPGGASWRRSQRCAPHRPDPISHRVALRLTNDVRVEVYRLSALGGRRDLIVFGGRVRNSGHTASV